MTSDPEKLINKHQQLTHTDNMKVVNHQQREKGEWFINSIMIEGCDVPFKFNRKQKYKRLSKGQRVNMTYYPVIETVAGLNFEYMKVVRIKRS